MPDRASSDRSWQKRLKDMMAGLPPSPSDGVYRAIMLPDQIARLTTLHRAILEWAERASNTFERKWRGWPTLAEGVPSHGCDPQADDAAALLDIERTMYGGLAVAIAAICERHVKPFIRMKQAAGTEKDAAWEELARVHGYEHYNRARLLANCYKHNEGRADNEYVRGYEGPDNAVISYEKEEWQKMIAGAQAFLTAVCRLWEQCDLGGSGACGPKC